MGAKFDFNRLGWILHSRELMLEDESILKEFGGKKVKEDLWKFPGLCMYAYRLLEAFPDDLDLTPSASFRLEGWGYPEKDLGERRHPFWGVLFPFQQEGISYLISSTLKGSLLRLSPGMGKCACAIIAAQVLGYKRVLIISPLTLLLTWVYECDKWGKINCQIAYGKDPIPDEGWVVTNYDTAVRNVDRYKLKWDLIILDESVMLKNRKTQRLKAMLKLRGSTKKVWELSGSPTTRFVDDLYPQFKLLDPQSFPSYWRFAEFYCNIKETPWGKEVTSSKRMDFQKEFKDLMFVKDQSRELKLPEVFYETINLEMGEEQSKVYYEIQDNLVSDLSSSGLTIPNRIAQLTRLQQAVSCLLNLGLGFTGISCKVDAVEEMLKLEAWQLPILIWVHWKGTGSWLFDILQDLHQYKVAYLHGFSKDRDKQLLDYQKGRTDIQILSLGVGKYGLNSLLGTKTVVYVDKTFSMDTYVQSFYRVKRIGLTHSPLVITLRCLGTVDELVEDNLAGKAIDISRISDAELVGLLRGLGRSHKILKRH